MPAQIIRHSITRSVEDYLKAIYRLAPGGGTASPTGQVANPTPGFAVTSGGKTGASNFLFSTGPNSQGGGKRTTKGHYDVPMRDCTVALDNDVIIERGKLADDKMQVAFVLR